MVSIPRPRFRSRLRPGGAGVYNRVFIRYFRPMIQPEQLVEGEWAEWYRLTPVQRWLESGKLWQTYLALGGSLESSPTSGEIL